MKGAWTASHIDEYYFVMALIISNKSQKRSLLFCRTLASALRGFLYVSITCAEDLQMV